MSVNGMPSKLILSNWKGCSHGRRKLIIRNLNFMLKLKLTLILPLILTLACQPSLPEDIGMVYQNLPEKIDFNFDVRPILSDRCSPCHGPDEKARKAELRLDVEERAFAKLTKSEGYAFVAGNIRESNAATRILSTDPEVMMPPPDSKLTLTPKEKAIILKWIEQGAEWKAHWAFTPPEKSELPSVQNKEWAENPIDYFILERLEREGLSPSTETNKETLIRRVTLDLIGLPPTLEEIDVFLNDKSPQAYEKLVDWLMASPHFGERWCWDWLDAARYADTNGFQNDPERNMWPWRDWAIKAINDNMPYDQFTIEQLAGDLLPNATPDQILATAFNRNHMYNGEGGRIPEETRVENVFDRVETMGTLWLGLTINCTRCHDHKFDPLTQKEYYQFFDYFNQTSEEGVGYTGRVKPILDLSGPLELEKVAKLQAFVDEIGQKVAAIEKNLYPHKEGETPAESPATAGLDGDQLYALGTEPSKRNPYYLGLLNDEHKEKEPKYAKSLEELKDAIGERDKQSGDNLQVMVMDQLQRPRPSFILNKGTYDQRLEQVKMGVPAVLPPLPPNAVGNRLALAQWLVSPDHPLTARVTVNRFWQAFFGTGLVKTLDDFGVQGEKPSHPALLDWLAVTFMKSDWDVKALFKTIVMSATYGQSSKVTPELLERDPDNRLLARGVRFRLPSWMLRDQALYISGLLQDSIGGPAVKPYQPEGIWEEATFGFKKYEQDHGNDLYRRTLYTFWRRIVGPTMLFDNSTRQNCSVNSSRTNTPSHALTTLNDITYVEAARVMAERLLTSISADDKRIDRAFRLATARLPQPEEKQLLIKRLHQLKTDFSYQPEEARKLIQVGEYRQNKTLDVIEQAAYTALCSMIINLDEAVTKQ